MDENDGWMTRIMKSSTSMSTPNQNSSKRIHRTYPPPDNFINCSLRTCHQLFNIPAKTPKSVGR
jgi:hypothetical protein